MTCSQTSSDGPLCGLITCSPDPGYLPHWAGRNLSRRCLAAHNNSLIRIELGVSEAGGVTRLPSLPTRNHPIVCANPARLQRVGIPPTVAPLSEP